MAYSNLYFPGRYFSGAPVSVATSPTAEAICNSALVALGASEITFLTDDNERARLCNRLWPTVRDMVLRAHVWNCALKRVQFAAQSVGITRSGSTATVTLASHGFATGDLVTIAGADQTEYNGTFTITVVTTNTFTYAVTGTPATPATGTITASLLALWGYTYAFILPSDFVRLVEVEDETDYKIEGGRLLSDSSALNVKYVRQETDPSKYDKLLVGAMIAAMTMELAYPIARSQSAQAAATQLYAEKLRMARGVDGLEEPQDTIGDFPLLSVRG